MSKLRKMNAFMIKRLFPFLFLIFFFLFCGEKKAYISPESKNITESVYASGVIKSKNQYEVYSKSNGIVDEIFVNEGSFVERGDTLLRISNENSKIATDNARIASETADILVNSDKLREAKNAIELAAKKKTNDSSLYVRQKNLWEKNIGSKNEFEQRELSFENSKANLIRAKTEYNDLKRQLKLASKQSKNNLQMAKLLEADFIVRSEVDGVVYQLNKEKGELISGLEPFAVIGSETFIIELTIDEYDIVKIKKGQAVLIRMDSYDAQVFEAEIVSIEPMMNARTRSFSAEAFFKKRPTELFPDLTAEANIVIQTKKNALTIPRSYLINDSMVLIKGGDLRKVEVGLMDYNLVEILDGIDESDVLELLEK